MITESVAAELVAERKRQVKVEGYAPRTHDDQINQDGQMARAAAAYAYGSIMIKPTLDGSAFTGMFSVLRWLWPWHYHSYKPKGARRDLVRAGALIIAEIERLDRKAAKK